MCCEMDWKYNGDVVTGCKCMGVCCEMDWKYNGDVLTGCKCMGDTLAAMCVARWIGNTTEMC